MTSPTFRFEFRLIAQKNAERDRQTLLLKTKEAIRAPYKIILLRNTRKIALQFGLEKELLRPADVFCRSKKTVLGNSVNDGCAKLHEH